MCRKEEVSTVVSSVRGTQGTTVHGCVRSVVPAGEAVKRRGTTNGVKKGAMCHATKKTTVAGSVVLSVATKNLNKRKKISFVESL